MQRPVSLSMKRGDPWFDDGNIILVPQESEASPPVAFRVHRGVLSRHSEIFQGMFELPQPDTVFDTVEGCQVIPMYDIPAELSNLVKALYDGATFSTRSVNDFFYLAGILRLATKYFIAHLRLQAIQFLTQTWSFTLQGHDEMIDLAVRTPIINQLSYPYVHPIHVLNLARETHVRIVVPSALYFLSLYPLHDLLRGDHAKLQVEHPSKPSSDIDLSDIRSYTLMFQRRLDVILEFIRKICGERDPSPGCVQNKSCQRSFIRVSSRLSSSWVMRTGPFNFMFQVSNQVFHDESICMSCREAFRDDVEKYRQQMWDELPIISGLPAWDELIKEDLTLP